LTEQELCKTLGIESKSWDHLIRGVRRPSHELMNELMKILGDEVILLFLSNYMEEPFPKFVPADELKQDDITKSMQEKIKKVKSGSGKFKYLNN
jgi:hypothetical protein